MIIAGTILKVADNSGAKTAKCIGFMGSSRVRWAEVGDTITVVIKSAIPNGKAAKAQKYKAVIVRTKSPIRRKDGYFISFDTNAVVLIDNKGELIGTNVFGAVARDELRERSFAKILSLAKETR